MDYSRQMELIDVQEFNNKCIPIHVIGCGATGSWVGTLLAKMGFEHIHLYDGDIVELHNLPNQNFDIHHIDMNKAEALKQVLIRYGAEGVESSPSMVNMLNAPKEGYVFILTDTVKSRKEIFESLAIKPAIRGIIETRMSMDTVQVYSVKNDPEAYAMYRLTMSSATFTDETVVTSACGVSQTIATTAAFTASLAVRQLVHLINETTTAYKEAHASLDTFQLVAV
jgi:hypothetical protein